MATNRLSRKQRRELRREQEYVNSRHNDCNFTMRRISALTTTQEEVFYAYGSGLNIAAIGTAGTGKTFVAMYLALSDVLEGEYDKVIIIRSAVQTRDQGFMPGTLAEKEQYFEGPYIDIATDLFERKDAYKILKQKGQVEFMTSSFVRGKTFDNAVIIVDEAQNFTYHEASSIITRLGGNSRIIFCGDTKQNDLVKTKYDVSGFGPFINILRKMKSFGVIEFVPEDIVRGTIVKEFILAEESFCCV